MIDNDYLIIYVMIYIWYIIYIYIYIFIYIIYIYIYMYMYIWYLKTFKNFQALTLTLESPYIVHNVIAPTHVDDAMIKNRDIKPSCLVI